MGRWSNLRYTPEMDLLVQEGAQVRVLVLFAHVDRRERGIGVKRGGIGVKGRKKVKRNII